MNDSPAPVTTRTMAALGRLLESSEEGYLILDADHRYVYINETAARLNGRPASEHLGRSVDEIVPSFRGSSLAERYARVMTQQAEEHFEFPHASQGRWYQVSLFPHEGGLISRFRDITVHKRAEQERAELLARLEGERDRFRRLLQTAPAIINSFRGPEHVFDFVNDQFLALLPRARDFLGKTVREAQPELASQGLFQVLDHVYMTGEPHTSLDRSVPIPGPDGRLEERFFSFCYQALRDADGKIEGVMSFAFDVSESARARRASEQLARREEAARRAAEEASRAKDEFLSTLSHELRTPLSAVIGWAHLLRSGNVQPEQRERALETIERNARAQSRLIEDMLDLSRIVQGKMVMSVGPVELVRVVEAALDSMRPAAEAKGIRLQPVLDSHATIVGDADRLQQLVWNLLSNAIKFTPKGGRVQVRLRREASYVEITVADTGQGITAEFLPHIFDRFRQADSSITRQVGGLGLGLAIVRSLVELHGGTIKAESDGPGLGATFTVRLPTAPLRTDVIAGTAEAGAPPVPSFECPAVMRGARILVVDDEPDTRSLLHFVLAQCEAHVTLATGAEDALRVLASESFDVMVSDIGMPDIDGLSLIRRVRVLPAPAGRIPALALTAYARSEDRTAALKAGFQMHLPKPIEPGELLVVIATLITSYPQR